MFQKGKLDTSMEQKLRETKRGYPQEIAALFWVKDEGLNQSRENERWKDSREISKAKSTGLVDQLDLHNRQEGSIQVPAIAKKLAWDGPLESAF